jgi:hypothetical protein
MEDEAVIPTGWSFNPGSSDTGNSGSRNFVTLGDEGTITDEFVYPFWETASDADRIKGAPSYWWLRSPNVGYTRHVRFVSTTGTLNYGSAYSARSLSLVVVVY